jgi:hypothetical protein
MGSADDCISVYSHTLGAIVCLGLPCSASFSWAVPSLGPIEQSALKSFLGASCVSEMVMSVSCPGIGTHCLTQWSLKEMKSPIVGGLDSPGIETRCPTWGLLVEMNSPILVGLDVLGIGSSYLGEENELTWYQLPIRDNSGCRAHRYSMVGIVGKLGCWHRKVSHPWLSADSYLSWLVVELFN